MLQPHGKANRPRRDPQLRLRLVREPLMRGGRRMRDEAFRIAEVVRDFDNAQRIHEAEGRRLVRAKVEGDEGTARRHLLFRYGALRMVGASGIHDAFHLGPVRQKIGDPGGARRLPLDAERQSFEPLQKHPGVERAERGAGLPQIVLEMVQNERRVRQHHPAEAAALPVDMFRGGIDHHVRAELKRLLQHRRREDIIDHQERTGAFRDCGHGREIDKFEGRVRRAFAEKHAGVIADGASPGGEIAAVDKRSRDAEPWQQLLDHDAARAEHRLRRNGMIASFQIPKERRRNRRHAGCRRSRSLRTFEKSHARLEHGVRRVREAAVGVALHLVLEPRLGLGGAVVDEARGQKQRLGCFAKGRAKRAAVNEKRIGMKVCEAVFVGHFPSLRAI